MFHHQPASDMCTAVLNVLLKLLQLDSRRDDFPATHPIDKSFVTVVKFRCESIRVISQTIREPIFAFSFNDCYPMVDIRCMAGTVQSTQNGCTIVRSENIGVSGIMRKVIEQNEVASRMALEYLHDLFERNWRLLAFSYHQGGFLISFNVCMFY